MSKDLVRDTEPMDFRCNNAFWRDVLPLAHAYGWQPAGTVPPELPEDFEPKTDWDPSNYFTNDYQTVTDGDARAIADALNDALADIPGQRNPDAATPPTTLAKAVARLSAAQTPSERDAIMAQAGFIWMPGAGLEGFSTLMELAGFVRRGPMLERFATLKANGFLAEFITFCRAGAFRIG